RAVPVASAARASCAIIVGCQRAESINGHGQRASGASCGAQAWRKRYMIPAVPDFPWGTTRAQTIPRR
ncbi:unnamed protein product, partial [Pelagomonas calceolata]